MTFERINRILNRVTTDYEKGSLGDSERFVNPRAITKVLKKSIPEIKEFVKNYEKKIMSIKKAGKCSRAISSY